MWMRKPSIHLPIEYGEVGFAYGLGFFMSQYKGWEHIQHSGGLPPYESLLSMFPAKKLSVFTSSNIGPIKLNPHVLHAFIFETFNGADNAEQEARIVGDAWKFIEENKKEKVEKRLEKFLKDKASRYRPIVRADELVGEFGNGAAGDAAIVEKWNNDTGATGLYVTYGKHGTGWLEAMWPPNPIYKITFDSDILQDFYGADNLFWLVGDAESIEFLVVLNGEFESFGVFKAGVSLDKLPPIPWQPDSSRADS